MTRLMILLNCLIGCMFAFAQSISFQTYVNPVIPGDHPDPTLTKIGKYFYTSGSSFNPTPKIYRSTDLVHWEVIAQPVSASWTGYGDSPGGGIWGGHMILYNGIYWHFFGRGGGNMYFVTANQPEGPWSTPTAMRVPAGMPAGLGVDNSIFIDDDGKWYLLTKAGQPNNHIVELGQDGQPTGKVLNLTWLNPAPSYPYGWAEGPVMWKYNGYYYYSFAQHLAGAQYVMRSDTLADDKSAWTIVGTNIFTGPSGSFNTPNHISPAVLLDDGTSWVIAHSYHSSWYAQGRQGLLCQVTYNDQGFPVIQFPPNTAVQAPVLPSSGIPWTVPKSDRFNASKLNPEWSFLGYTPDAYYSLTEREGWLHLEPYRGSNTVIKNDGEHNYSLITKVDFEPQAATDEAGLWIINGPETHRAKVFSTVNSEGQKALVSSFMTTSYQVENAIGSVVWLKLVRNEHMISGFYSSDGIAWNRIGEPINATALNLEQTQFNNFTGNRQGLYVVGRSSADFDLYIYRDAYTKIMADSPANQYGTSRGYSTPMYILDNIHVGDWAMYAGVEFGNAEYDKTPDSLKIIASSNTTGGSVEVWLDSLETGEKIGECSISNTGSWRTFQTFASAVKPVSGRHDVYLRFTGTGTDRLFQLQSLYFKAKADTSTTSVTEPQGSRLPKSFDMEQNFPNPFNPSTTIRYSLPTPVKVNVTIYNLLGMKVRTLVDSFQKADEHSAVWDAKDDEGNSVSSGIYFCRLEAGDVNLQRKMVLVR